MELGWEVSSAAGTGDGSAACGRTILAAGFMISLRCWRRTRSMSPRPCLVGAKQVFDAYDAARSAAERKRSTLVTNARGQMLPGRPMHGCLKR